MRAVIGAGYLAILVVLAAGAARAAEPGFTVGGVIAGAGQGERVDSVGGTGDGWGLPMQPELSLRAGEAHRFLVKLGFAAGNGRNPEGAFRLSPWAADLADDVRDINGRGRDHLLTAWYRLCVPPGDAIRLALTAGLIDATDYLDDNAFSNDEYTQFLNEALVNGPNAFLPSYDVGAALEFEAAAWHVRAVYMNVGENDDGNDFHFVGGQVGYRLRTSLGEGTYRILGALTDPRFLDPSGTGLERRAVVLASLDQELGRALGAYVRLGVQDDRAAIDFGRILSGGVQIRGAGWGRPDDTVGLGAALLDGGNRGLRRTRVGEAYYRLVLHPFFAATLDVQYMADDYRDDPTGPRGWILGLRVDSSF